MRVAGHYHHLDFLRGFVEQAANPGHSIRVGLGEVVVEDHEATEGFGDAEAQQQADLFAGTDRDSIELSFVVPEADAGGV